MSKDPLDAFKAEGLDLTPELLAAARDNARGCRRHRVARRLNSTDPVKLEAFRSEAEALASSHFSDNVLRQGYSMPRAVKS